MKTDSLHQDRILILDFGSQLTQLIARRVRESGVYSEIWPFSASLERIKTFAPRGVDRAPPFRVIGPRPFAHATEYIISQVGVDRIMLGSDYCFEVGYDQPVQVVEELRLNSEQRKMILGGTAAKILKI